MPTPNYKFAELVNGDKPVTERWYIKFYVWDALQGELVRKRDYSVNTFKTKTARHDYAAKRIKVINKLLAEGYHVNAKAKRSQDVRVVVETQKDFTIEKAIRYIMPIVKQTKRHETFTSYNSVAGLFLKFCEAAGWDQWKIKTVTKADVITWLDFVQTEAAKEGGSISNTTRNNYKTAISALFSLMAERKILEVNPALGIKELGEEVSGNTAYTEDQIKELKSAIILKEPRLWLYISFMLYGFIRPGEIERLRVRMVNLDGDEIVLPGSITKNRKPRVVRVSKPFKKYIEQLALENAPPNDFVFGRNLLTGPVKIQKNFVNNLHRPILRDLNFGPEYGRYSWKHTGVILHYRAGIDIKTIQAQIGHQTLHETDIYLRSLNLYKNTEIEDKSPEI